LNHQEGRHHEGRHQKGQHQEGKPLGKTTPKGTTPKGSPTPGRKTARKDNTKRDDLATNPLAQDKISVFKNNISEILNKGFSCVDRGEFFDANSVFMQAIAQLVNFDKNAYMTFAQEILFTVRYAQASHFLYEMQRLKNEKLYRQMALIAKYVGDLTLQPQHQLINMRIAIRINFQVGNFYTAARFINLISLPEKEQYSEILKAAEEKDYKDLCVLKDAPDYIVLCYLTMRVIHGSSYSKCSFCAATFRAQSLSNCIFCKSVLELKARNL